jgi:hypothetical protein
MGTNTEKIGILTNRHAAQLRSNGGEREGEGEAAHPLREEKSRKPKSLGQRQVGVSTESPPRKSPSTLPRFAYPNGPNRPPSSNVKPRSGTSKRQLTTSKKTLSRKDIRGCGWVFMRGGEAFFVDRAWLVSEILSHTPYAYPHTKKPRKPPSPQNNKHVRRPFHIR